MATFTCDGCGGKFRVAEVSQHQCKAEAYVEVMCPEDGCEEAAS